MLFTNLILVCILFLFYFIHKLHISLCFIFISPYFIPTTLWTAVGRQIFSGLSSVIELRDTVHFTPKKFSHLIYLPFTIYAYHLLLPSVL